MDLRIVFVTAALALGAGCDREPERNAPASSGASAPPPAQAQVNTPSTPANVGAPSAEEKKKESDNPVQGQVDPKASGQKQDFKQRGDGAGPKSGG